MKREEKEYMAIIDERPYTNVLPGPGVLGTDIVVVESEQPSLRTMEDFLGNEITLLIDRMNQIDALADAQLQAEEKMNVAPFAYQLLQQEKMATNWALLRLGAVLHVCEYHSLYQFFNGGYDKFSDMVSDLQLDNGVVELSMNFFSKATYLAETVGLEIITAIPAVNTTTLKALDVTQREIRREAKQRTEQTPLYSTMSRAEREQVFDRNMQEVLVESTESIHQALQSPTNYLQEHLFSQKGGTQMEREQLVLPGTLNTNGDFIVSSFTIPRDSLQGGLGMNLFILKVKYNGVYYTLPEFKRFLDEEDGGGPDTYDDEDDD